MRRRSRASSKVAKGRSRKTMPKRTNAPIGKRRGDASVADLQARLERQTHELIEARESKVPQALSMTTVELPLGNG
jgi:hypothetical protein